jgi:hypothetical protein
VCLNFAASAQWTFYSRHRQSTSYGFRLPGCNHFLKLFSRPSINRVWPEQMPIVAFFFGRITFGSFADGFNFVAQSQHYDAPVQHIFWRNLRNCSLSTLFCESRGSVRHITVEIHFQGKVLSDHRCAAACVGHGCSSHNNNDNNNTRVGQEHSLLKRTSFTVAIANYMFALGFCERRLAMSRVIVCQSWHTSPQSRDNTRDSQCIVLCEWDVECLRPLFEEHISWNDFHAQPPSPRSLFSQFENWFRIYLLIAFWSYSLFRSIVLILIVMFPQ